MLSSEIIMWLSEGQHWFNDIILQNLTAIRDGKPFFAYTSLALVGFLYGILHAIGPGHGKIVVSSYVLANENSLKRGLIVVVLAALLQGLTAIALVTGFYYLLASTRAQAEHWATLLETASFALIGFIGLGLIFRGLKDLLKFELHKKEGCCGCGHPHTPTASDLQKSDYASMAAMIISIGIRPCSGALILLFFSCLMDLALPGIVATLTMALGTAITIGTLATLAVKSKDLAFKFVEKTERRMRLTHALLRLSGGLVILLFSLTFLLSGLSTKTETVTSVHPLYRSLR